jgi:hypothetical protein
MLAETKKRQPKCRGALSIAKFTIRMAIPPDLHLLKGPDNLSVTRQSVETKSS